MSVIILGRTTSAAPRPRCSGGRPHDAGRPCSPSLHWSAAPRESMSEQSEPPTEAPKREDAIPSGEQAPLHARPGEAPPAEAAPAEPQPAGPAEPASTEPVPAETATEPPPS